MGIGAPGGNALYNLKHVLWFQWSWSALNVLCHWCRSGEYVGNAYGAGTGDQCLNNVLCRGTETSFLDCYASIDRHINPSKDVSICCTAGMMNLTVSVTVRTDISIVCVCSSLTLSPPCVAHLYLYLYLNLNLYLYFILKTHSHLTQYDIDIVSKACVLKDRQM